MRLKNLKFFLKRNSSQITKVFLVSTWGIITVISLGINFNRKEEKIIIIRETKSGNYIIPEANGQQVQWNSSIDAESLFKVNFIKRYLALVYNFDRSSVDEQLNLGTDLMTTEFFEKSSGELNELRKSVKANAENMTQSFEVLAITKVSPTVFDVDGRISTVKEGKNYSFEYRIEIHLREASKTRTNPWGLEVADVKETRK